MTLQTYHNTQGCNKCYIYQRREVMVPKNDKIYNSPPDYQHSRFEKVLSVNPRISTNLTHICTTTFNIQLATNFGRLNMVLKVIPGNHECQIGEIAPMPLSLMSVVLPHRATFTWDYVNWHNRNDWFQDGVHFHTTYQLRMELILARELLFPIPYHEKEKQTSRLGERKSRYTTKHH